MTPDPLGNATTALDTAFDLLAAAADLLNKHAKCDEIVGTLFVTELRKGPNDEMRLAMEISEFLDGRLR
jgi:hypothetical protein